jgi:phage gpG-like protein
MAIGHSFPGVKSGTSKAGLVDVTMKPLPIVLVGQFGALSESVKTFRKPLEQCVKEVIIPSMRKNFDVEGRPRWKMIAPQTEYRRSYDGYPTYPILDRSGKGKRSALAFARWKFTKDSTFMGGQFPKTTWYMPVHQSGLEGSWAGGEGIDARPFALIQDEDQKKIEAVFVKWFEKNLDKTGFRTT